MYEDAKAGKLLETENEVESSEADAASDRGGYRPLRQLITSCYLSVICRKTGARRRCSGGQDSVLSTFASFRNDFEHRPAHF